MMKAKEQGTRDKGQGTRDKAQGTRHKAKGTREKEQGTRHKVQGTRARHMYNAIAVVLKRHDFMNDAGSEKRFNKNPFLLKILGMGASYFVKTPWWLKKIYPGRVWDIKTKEKIIYLSFDDGPNPIATPFVLDQLKKYNAKATFFCIGKNAGAYPEIYK